MTKKRHTTGHTYIECELNMGLKVFIVRCDNCSKPAEEVCEHLMLCKQCIELYDKGKKYYVQLIKQREAK